MTRPSIVWLARHAETSVPGVFHGAESDVGLSDVGHRQAIAAAGWFRELRPTAVVSSAMTRATETAGPIAAACGCPHHVEPGLHERRIGTLSGTTFSPADGPWAETARRWTAGETSYSTPGAESFDEITARVVPTWNRAMEKFPDGRVVVIAHGIVCKVLLLSLLDGKGPADWATLGRSANLAVSELTPNGLLWEAGQLLTVPPPVAALTPAAGPAVRSEA